MSSGTRSVVFAVFLSVACGGQSSETAPTLSYVYVSAALGDDAKGNGSQNQPFRTVTRGLSEAKEDFVVQVDPGTYDAAAGETFPLMLKAGVKVRGDRESFGVASQPTLIDGSGTFVSPSLGAQKVAVVAVTGAEIAGLEIRAAGGVALLSEGVESAVVESNTITGSAYGFVGAGSGTGSLRRNHIRDNAVAGVATFGSTAPQLRENVITGNGRGVVASGESRPDLGTADDPGGNELTGNRNCGLENATSSRIDAVGNTWSADVFLFAASSTCANGAPIANSSSGAVVYQYVPLSDAPIFPGTKPIVINAPETGSLVATNSPSFSWDPSRQSLVTLGVFTEPPRLASGAISNTDALVWIWYTGLGRGREGNVQFSDGATVPNGNLAAAVEPVPLTRGRSYYWAVWAWDAAGLQIQFASPIAYFIVAN